MDVVAVAVAVLVYSVLARRVRFSTLALLAILSVPVMTLVQTRQMGVAASPLASSAAGAAAASVPAAAQGGAVPADPESQLTAFYAAEAQRKLVLSAGGQAPAFDLVVLNVCSLAWDDLDFVGMRDHPFFKRFDAVFSQFNTAASYSGPGMIRLLHGTCGQPTQKAMYDGLEPQCYAFPSLEKLGYRTAGLLNHDGVFDNFKKEVEQHGGLTGKMLDNHQARVHMNSFDGSPIYNDGALLSQWWKDRQTQGTQPVALYYNTISLHDGNRVPGLTSRSSVDTFKPRLTQLLADFDQFLTELESSGRPVVVMLVPEHGAGLRGDKLQISGMREIPGPRITLVPAAIKVVGMPRPAGQTGPLLVDQPTSYFGLYTLLNDLLGQTPYGPTAKPMAERLKNLPTTAFVSQNEDVVVMGSPAQGYQLRSGAGSWIPYAQ
jgi:cellulose synthase operon protein YhjU